MKSCHHHRGWSLRPEELLIESARERLAAQAAFDNAIALDADTTDPVITSGEQTLIPTALQPVITWLSRRLAPSGLRPHRAS